MARTRKSKPFRSDDAAPLLENDELAHSFESMQSDFDILEPAPEPSMASQVGAIKKSGRKAVAKGGALHQRRRDEVMDAGVDMLKEGAFMGADALVPGLGSGLGAVDSLAAMRGASKEGASLGKASAKEVVSTGIGFIPVVGEVFGFCEAIYKMGKATLQTGKSRTAEKLAAAQKLKADCERGLLRINDVRAQMSDYTGKDRSKLLGRLDKAEARMYKGIRLADEWLEKKAEKGSLPLVADVESGASDDWAQFD